MFLLKAEADFRIDNDSNCVKVTKDENKVEMNL